MKPVDYIRRYVKLYTYTFTETAYSPICRFRKWSAASSTLYRKRTWNNRGMEVLNTFYVLNFILYSK